NPQPSRPPTPERAPAPREPGRLPRLEGLALPVRRAVSGQMAGARRSRKRGRSIEFADFRNYTPGDDFRLIDWNAYARLDRFMLRLFTAEEELPLSLFVDLSGSMDWGTPNKAVTARRLAGAIAYVALAALDRAQQEGAVLQLLAPQETSPDWSGDARLKDAETGLEREFTATPLTQAAYVNALAQRTAEIERAAHRRGLRFARLSTDAAIDEMVQRTLRRLGLLA